jgi:Rhodopirellula transposase DDE domain
LTIFDKVVEHCTAGLPQDQSVKWTQLSQAQIASKMAAEGCPVSCHHVRQMLSARGFKKRSLLKNNELKVVEGRNEQFEKIARLREAFALNEQPILSMDTKKKELLGNFHRQGSTYSTEKKEVNDHDFLSFADGQLVPHGIYDVQDNMGYMTLGISKDTSEFVCDNIKVAWLSHLQFKYALTHTLLLLCDGGGSNSCLHHIFKQDLIKLAKELQINILVAHYPAYCSKYNPIEHRLFSQISHTWSGVPLRNIQFVKELTDSTTTKTGLKVSTTLNLATYQTKRPVEDDFKNQVEQFIIFDDKCPKWNYLIKYES